LESVAEKPILTYGLYRIWRSDAAIYKIETARGPEPLISARCASLV
jgi:hypothetical protein